MLIRVETDLTDVIFHLDPATILPAKEMKEEDRSAIHSLIQEQYKEKESQND